ncbi:MAG: insulinase family protein, partial [Pseudomonas sp.]
MPAVCVADDLLAPPHRLVLPNGAMLQLIHLPWAARAAAVARVNAGCHDEPPEYPGLAHFLEHLVFLGSADYPPLESLIPFVQRCAGQVNACTRERHTDYFFEVPAAALEEGLRRLLDMLAWPLLEPEAQACEREVLHAEFMARAEDAETLRDAAFGTGVAPGHPFAAFHAGHRETLPLEQGAFQQALLGFRRRFYHAGQIELVAAGPQPLAELAALAADSG